MQNRWDPQQYQKYEKERDQPFHDLLELVLPRKEMMIIDLGCGPGRLTKQLHERLKAKSTLGIDASSTMLEEAKLIQQPGLQFQKAEINSFSFEKKYDLIFSNAALQWVPGHELLLKRYSQHLNTHGQIAIQVPANQHYLTHTIAKQMTKEVPFSSYLREEDLPAILEPEHYSQLFYQLGFKRQIVRAQIYPHLLSSTEDLLEWVKGSLLTYFQSRLPASLYTQFFAMYRMRVLESLGESSPFFFPINRLLLWACNE